MAAAVWYDERKPGLGTDFWDAVRAALHEIQSDPRRFSPLENVQSHRELRRYVLKRFPYLIIYEVVPNDIIVAAVAHTSRKPGYWLDRLPSTERRG